MHITLEVSGGFVASPVLNAPHTVDTSTIDPDRGSELETLVRDVRFFELPARLGAPSPGAADFFAYTITVNDGDQMHSVAFTDPVADDGLARLVDLLRSSP